MIRLLHAFIACLILSSFDATAARAQGKEDELVSIKQEVGRLYAAGRYTDAEPVAEKYISLARERYGDGHVTYAEALSWLAYIYQTEHRRPVDVEALYKRALVILEKSAEAEKLQATVLGNLALLLAEQGRLDDAEPKYQQALEIDQRLFGSTDVRVARRLEGLGVLRQRQRRNKEAEQFFLRSARIFAAAAGTEHPDVARVTGHIATNFEDQNNVVEAEKYYKQQFAILEKNLGPNFPNVVEWINQFASFYLIQQRAGDAEALLKRAILITEHAFGPDHPVVGKLLLTLGRLAYGSDRFEEAAALYQRALAVFDGAPERGSADKAAALLYLGRVYRRQSRYPEAESVLQQSLALAQEYFGPDHPETAWRLESLGSLYGKQERYADVEPLYQRALKILEKSLGPDDPEVATVLSNLGLLYSATSRAEEAKEAYERAIAIYKRLFGADSEQAAAALNNLAALHLHQKEWSLAAEFWRRSTQSTIRLRVRSAEQRANTSRADDEYLTRSTRDEFWGLIKSIYRAPGGQDESAARETFLAAQWAFSLETARILAQMAARSAPVDSRLSSLVRERQDSIREWELLDNLRVTLLSKAPKERDTSVEAKIQQDLVRIEARIANLDVSLKADFPDYGQFARPDPLTVEEVQKLLGQNEALVLFLDTPAWASPPGGVSAPEETFIWLITKTDVHWARSDVGRGMLEQAVYALRCGVDSALWDDPDGSSRCRSLLSMEPPRDAFGEVRAETLPFDLAKAHSLFKDLFGQFEERIRGKHLLIVPSGALTQLPYHLLVTVPTNDKNYRSAGWFARTHPITILPAVSSLKALRRVARPSSAAKPMIGFGNPLLDGNPRERPWEARWAALARDKACKDLPLQQVAEATHKTRGVLTVARRDGHADLAGLRSLVPLPDTADELCGVAKDLKLSPDDIWLGVRATETNLKMLSDQGKLAQYRVLHLATHGTLAGEISGSNEPGLIFTPPKVATDLDDGYLSASEVASLKLDADWVILSACNTAAGGAQGAEALSGLARAFIYAGARALLVSHWSVDSTATVKLITSAVGATTHDKAVGRAEALRRAMLAMIENGETREAHPAFWAPFVVVGEGAAVN